MLDTTWIPLWHTGVCNTAFQQTLPPPPLLIPTPPPSTPSTPHPQTRELYWHRPTTYSKTF